MNGLVHDVLPVAGKDASVKHEGVLGRQLRQVEGHAVIAEGVAEHLALGVDEAIRVDQDRGAVVLEQAVLRGGVAVAQNSHPRTVQP